jgi:hypothetical protein
MVKKDELMGNQNKALKIENKYLQKAEKKAAKSPKSLLRSIGRMCRRLPHRLLSARGKGLPRAQVQRPEIALFIMPWTPDLKFLPCA